MKNSDGGWTFDLLVAELRCGALRGRVNVSRPQDGVHNLRIDDEAIEGELLSATWSGAAHGLEKKSAAWPAPVADAYVRDGDLVATYGQMPNWPYAPQIYWRVESVSILGTKIPTLSLLVSIQTDSLDTQPAIRVATRLPAVEVVEMGLVASAGRTQALLWRLTDADLSYVEIVPTSDFCDVSVACDEAGRFTTEWSLFGEFLEKGVIRRARMMSIFLPHKRDEELAAEYCREFQRRPLPLTT
jgi:hypothetical protein